MAFLAVMVTLPGNLRRYLQKQSDLVDLAAPFLRAIMRLGTFAARLFSAS